LRKKKHGKEHRPVVDEDAWTTKLLVVHGEVECEEEEILPRRCNVVKGEAAARVRPWKKMEFLEEDGEKRQLRRRGLC